MPANENWKVFGKARDHTIWFDGEVYQATSGAIPKGHGGYPLLESLLRLKNILPHQFSSVPEDETDVHVTVAPDVEGKPAWHGHYRDADGWQVADGGSGPIAYMTPEYALAGAKHMRDEAKAAPTP